MTTWIAGSHIPKSSILKRYNMLAAYAISSICAIALALYLYYRADWDLDEAGSGPAVCGGILFVLVLAILLSLIQ